MPLCCGCSWTMTFVPMGASGVALKSKFPSSYWYADIFGFMLDGRSRLRVMFVCGMNLSHKCNGQSGSAIASSAMK